MTMLISDLVLFHRFKVGKTSPQMVGDVFRCLVPAMGNEETRVVMPLLAAGAQARQIHTLLFVIFSNNVSFAIY